VNKKTIAVIGANGYVGSQICQELETSSQYRLIRVLRGDSLDDSIREAEVVIHAANPSRRFKAESDPQHDFAETADKTNCILTLAKGKKFLLISSLSCKTQMNTNYGRNRRFCELLALAAGGVVIRLGPMFGGNRKQDTLHDLLAGRQIFVSSKTRYAYVDVKWVGSKIVELIKAVPGCYEIGACNSVSLAELSEYFDSKSIFTGVDDTQIPEMEDEGPDARLVIDYARQEFENLGNWK
jgi:nucleoside-diphosphate-sugar epimerase